MPVHNGDSFLEESLDSLLSQDYKRIELIISDNGSTDATPEICRRYAALDKRVRYYRCEKHDGVVRNFNRVFELGKAEYFFWAAHDDTWESGFITQVLNALLETPNSALAFSAFDTIDEAGVSVKLYPSVFQLPSANLFARLRNYITQRGSLGKANLIYGIMPRSAIRRAGGFRQWGLSAWGMDMLVVFRILTLGNLALADDVLFHKRLAVPREGENGVHKAPKPSPERLLSFTGRVMEQWGYFYGYERIVEAADGLSFREKARLRTALTNRIIRTTLEMLSRSKIGIG